MAGISIKFTGADVAISNIKKKIENADKNAVDALNKWALSTVKIAKDYAPVDEGHLRGSINANYATLGKIEANITVNANYAAYIEFGTRKFAASYVSSLPQDWKEMAAQFKGKGGGGDVFEMIKNLMEWVRRKGISGTYSVKTQKRTGKKKDFANEDFDVAFQIALAILRKGIRPQPFLYPATKQTEKQLKDDIKDILK